MCVGEEIIGLVGRKGSLFSVVFVDFLKEEWSIEYVFLRGYFFFSESKIIRNILF